MSNIDRSIPNAAVIPNIESDLFVGHESAQFAAGLIAVGAVTMPGRQNEVDGYHLLRGNVYVEQKGFMSAEALTPDGREYDEDDARSAHFAVVENGPDGQRLVGSMRLIVKDEPDARPLPIEHFFPEAFAIDQAPPLSTEVSRFILRYEDAKTQARLKTPLFTAALSYVMAHGLGPTYAVIEEPVRRSLAAGGVPLDTIADPKLVSKYKTENLGVRIDTAELARRMGLQQQDVEALRASSEGITYYQLAQDTGRLALEAGVAA